MKKFRGMKFTSILGTIEAMQSGEGVPVYQDPRNEVLLKGLDLMMSNDQGSAGALWALVEMEDMRAADRKKRNDGPYNGPRVNGR
jgi:hypothetical protein